MNSKLRLKDSNFSVLNKIAILEFNRDDIRNALTGSNLINDIIETIEFINKNKNISVLIITGQGKAFSAGGNIKEMYKKNCSGKPSDRYNAVRGVGGNIAFDSKCGSKALKSKDFMKLWMDVSGVKSCARKK